MGFIVGEMTIGYKASLLTSEKAETFRALTWRHLADFSHDFRGAQWCRWRIDIEAGFIADGGN